MTVTVRGLVRCNKDLSWLPPDGATAIGAPNPVLLAVDGPEDDVPSNSDGEDNDLVNG